MHAHSQYYLKLQGHRSRKHYWYIGRSPHMQYNGEKVQCPHTHQHFVPVGSVYMSSITGR